MLGSSAKASSQKRVLRDQAATFFRMRIQPRAVAVGFAGLLALSAGCGGSQPPPSHSGEEPTEDGPRRNSSGGPDVSAEIGALDPGEVTKTFEAALPDMEVCMKAGARRVEFLGGSVEFKLKIDQAGSLTESFLERSSLGDRDTEKCLLTALGKRTWPSPQGGVHGLAQKGFEFDMLNDVRPPVMWESSQVSEALNELSGKLNECKSGSSGSFEVTLYVGTEGQALGVGIAQSSGADGSAADCIVEVLRGGKYPSPGSWPAKVAFSL